MEDRAPVENASELTRYLERRYHDRHREQVPALIALAAKVEAAHADDPTVPAGLADFLSRMQGDLEDHLRKEEIILFPAIRQGGNARFFGPITVMRSEHDDHTADLATLRQLTQGMTAPPHACRSWVALIEGLREFVTDLEEHIRLENDVLFPQFENT